MSTSAVVSEQTDILSSPEVDGLDLTEQCGKDRGLADRWLQRSVLKKLSLLTGGQIFIDDACNRFVLGTESDDTLTATVQVRNPDFYRRLAFGGSLGAAESYLDGHWECDDLVSFFRICCRNLDKIQKSSAGMNFTRQVASKLTHWLSRNTRAGSRKNIHAHYDLGNDFFELFLDSSMMYSSGIFEHPESTLEEAQQTRLEKVCHGLRLNSQDHVVEIGTGWGGFAIYAAKNVGCRVTTTTISKQQYDYARKRIADAGLSDRVEVLFDDYRDLEGRYDKLVSLEMIEAVGHQFYDQYFHKCASLLKPNGRMLLQAIVMPEQRYATYLRSVDFIQKYIFPGGCLPSISMMQEAMSRHSTMRMVGLNDFADGYARTLREWRHRFVSRLDEVKDLGYPNRFIRMWDYYLTYCEAAFEERSVGVVHVTWAK